MKGKSTSTRKSKKTTRRKTQFRVPEDLLIFFPKTSRMGRPDHSQWGQGPSTKKSEDSKMPAFSSSRV